MIALFLRPGYVFRFPDGERVYKVTRLVWSVDEGDTVHAEDVRDGSLLTLGRHEDVEILSPRQPDLKALAGTSAGWSA